MYNMDTLVHFIARGSPKTGLNPPKTCFLDIV